MLIKRQKKAQLPTHLLGDIAILLFYKDGCSHSLGHTQTALRPAAHSVLHQNDADSTRASQPTLTFVSTSLLPLTLESLWAGLLFLQGGLPLPMLERTCYFLLLKEKIPSCCNPSLNPSCSCTLSLVHRLPFLHIFECLCEANRNPKTSEVAQGLAQDEVKPVD